MRSIGSCARAPPTASVATPSAMVTRYFCARMRASYRGSLLFEHSLHLADFLLNLAGDALAGALVLDVRSAGRAADRFLGLALHFVESALGLIAGAGFHDASPDHPDLQRPYRNRGR